MTLPSERASELLRFAKRIPLGLNRRSEGVALFVIGVSSYPYLIVWNNLLIDLEKSCVQCWVQCERQIADLRCLVEPVESVRH